MKSSKSLWRQLWVLCLILLWSCCCVETAKKSETKGQKGLQEPRAANATADIGGKKEKENNFALQTGKGSQGILNLGCVGIRIRRYLSNGFCTSKKAIRDTICNGQCLPMDELPWFPEFSKIISRHKREWRCVPDVIRRRKVKFFCNDGKKRRYSIAIVRSCKCKRYTKKQNMSNPLGESRR